MEYTKEQLQKVQAEMAKKATKDGKKFFVVKYVHTDLEGWKKFLMPHAEYLMAHLKKGDLIVSGPLETGTEDRKEAMLVMVADNEESLMDVIKEDPYWIQGLVDSYTINEWQPIFRNF
ncbi:Hypothetical protein ADU72_0524 [Pediococcus damnosus]|uniref:YCII-related domain-containing protein n=1 Tax=Pediococcus damnosus TaxID=51663 RepID=A0AAC9B389_9LACO|nr:YciI family protein [Pediococcus damnosus]AMV61022.1 Hypothetical protein ADU69_1369 [Pediococcus damnosus]AMV63591.1 Hypothetical protein ADU70_2125 [Pediococcus damnosus]AMV65382.1 Hypothetical protein ADU71_1490 [Pediococcus damnosus]AMV66469.1 Hypothetical protein ADU72_0524 [Pediococcus damnosus]AMV68771.1 Hypothetical protein ADU73_0361 [Pediococcus damnosus]